jgi:hypothetical protein
MGGTAKRMETLANYIMKEIGYKLPTGSTLQDLTSSSLRFAMYKVGPVLCVSVRRLIIENCTYKIISRKIAARYGNPLDLDFTPRNNQAGAPREGKRPDLL